MNGFLIAIALLTCFITGCSNQTEAESILYKQFLSGDNGYISKKAFLHSWNSYDTCFNTETGGKICNYTKQPQLITEDQSRLCEKLGPYREQCTALYLAESKNEFDIAIAMKPNGTK